MTTTSFGRDDVAYQPDLRITKISPYQLSAELDPYREEMTRQALRLGSIDKRMRVLIRCEMAIGDPPCGQR